MPTGRKRVSTYWVERVLQRVTRCAVVTVSVAMVVTGLMAPSAGATGKSAKPTKLVTTTPPGKKSVSSIVWAVYTTPVTLDPIFTFTYPENTAVSLMCEALLRQAPTGSLEPGLATLSTPNPTTMVFTIRPGAKFWDGHPVTSTDVVYSLERAANPSLGGFYSGTFKVVKSITATSPRVVTITLTQPDYFFSGLLSGMPGVVIEKSYAQKEGKNYGTPAGGIMCTGAYKFKSWTPGVGVTAVANPHYWQAGVKAKVKQILIKGESTASALTSAMLTGSVQGYYALAIPKALLAKLESSSAVKVYFGPSYVTSGLVVSTLHGPLGNLKVRKALTLALDRKGLIKSLYSGAAQVPRFFSNPGTFGYGKSVFAKAYKKTPPLRQTLNKAKKLIQQAGATGKTITIGMSSQITTISAMANAFRAAGDAIGLNVKFKPTSAAVYGSFFTTPNIRKGVDGFFTNNYGTWGGPEALLQIFLLRGTSEDFDTFNTPAITSLLGKARGTANPTARARLMVKVEQLTMKKLPWIPFVEPDTVLVMSSNLTGAVSSFSYMYAPWANQLGGRG